MDEAHFMLSSGREIRKYFETSMVILSELEKDTSCLLVYDAPTSNSLMSSSFTSLEIRVSNKYNSLSFFLVISLFPPFWDCFVIILLNCTRFFLNIVVSFIQNNKGDDK